MSWTTVNEFKEWLEAFLTPEIRDEMNRLDPLERDEDEDDEDVELKEVETIWIHDEEVVVKNPQQDTISIQ